MCWFFPCGCRVLSETTSNFTKSRSFVAVIHAARLGRDPQILRWAADVRFDAHYGLKSDTAREVREGANKRHSGSRPSRGKDLRAKVSITLGGRPFAGRVPFSRAGLAAGIELLI
jgi:hypothetical protein